MRRLLLLLFVFVLALPLAAADDPAPDPGQTPDPSPPTSSNCEVVRSNGVDRPASDWLTFDPDGCYRRFIDRFLPPLVGVVPGV